MNAITETNPAPVACDDSQLSVSQPDIGQALRETAMLADVTVSVWSAERAEPKIMDEAKASAGAVGNVGRAVKNLMAGADGRLKDVRAAFAAVRSTHYALTLPWVSDPHAERLTGPRLLPNMLFDKYMRDMSGRKRAAMQALDAFVDDYPADIVKAQANLGGLARATDYPSAQEVRAKFHVAFDFEPMPSGADFAVLRALPPALIDRLAANLRAKQEAMRAAAAAAMWEQVGERVRHLADRLAAPGTMFKERTIEAVRELIMMLPGWDIQGDPRVAEITRDIDRMIAGVDAKTLRAKLDIRADVAEQARGVADKLAAWGL